VKGCFDNTIRNTERAAESCKIMIAKDKKQKTISMEGIHMNYVVIDLEMCKVPKMYRNKIYKYATEIIEIGTVLLKISGRLRH